MRFLLATNHLLGWTGSEITVATLAGVLRTAGHEVMVYAPFWSAPDIGQRLLGDTAATSQLAEVTRFAPDAAYTQHHTVVTAVRATLPACPIAHALLGVTPHLEQPPRLDLGIETFLAISEEVAQALVTTGIEPGRIRLFRNLVDDTMFNAAPAGRLRTVVCFSYKLGTTDLEALREQTQQRGLALIDRTPQSPGHTAYSSVPALLQQGEVVVASGRGAIEAMLCGRVPLVLANCGDDGLVTPANFKSLMRVNFSGRAGGGKFDAQAIGKQLDAYRPRQGGELQRRAREHLGLAARRESIVAMFESLAAAPPPALTATQLRQVEFEYETLELQRQFAQRAAEAPAGAVAPQSADTAALMQRGHDALRIHDHDAAQAAYLQAFRADEQSTAAGRSLASIVLVQLALRERRARNTDGQRQALRAFLALNPANIWVQDQLSALDRQP